VDRHYSHSYPAARYRYGLYLKGVLTGVAVYSVPSNYAALDCLPGSRDERIELGRFVLAPEAKANAESWFAARTFECLRREGLAGVLSFSDPEPRTNAAGEVLFGGHIGTIYQSLNARYLGRATARILRLLPDGTCLNARAISKLRAGDKGWRYVAEMLERHGAGELPSFESRIDWLDEWLPKITRPMRHSGNYRYAWALNKRDWKHVPPGQPYPKVRGIVNPQGSLFGLAA